MGPQFDLPRTSEISFYAAMEKSLDHYNLHEKKILDRICGPVTDRRHPSVDQTSAKWKKSNDLREIIWQESRSPKLRKTGSTSVNSQHPPVSGENFSSPAGSPGSINMILDRILERILRIRVDTPLYLFCVDSDDLNEKFTRDAENLSIELVELMDSE